MLLFKRTRIAHGWLLFLPLFHASTATISANLVLDWNAAMLEAVRIQNTSPTLSTRNLAILNLALYDAASSVDPTHQPYQLRLDTPADTSIEAAVAAAGYEVFKVLYPAVRVRADLLFDAWRTGAPDAIATTNGLVLGQAVAQAVLRSREDDGSATEVPYIPSDAPGQWRRTPPYFRPPLTPHWRYVRPFTLPDLEPFVPGPPPALESVEYARSLEEVRRWGATDSPNRTEEESLIAVFWSDFSYTGMPPGHWHEIAATIAQERGTSLPETARLMALLSLAQADAAIVCWEAKYRYNLWRPITAIRQAHLDGNPDTDADAAWDHFLAAPPFPAYPSGHSTFSASAAAVLAWFYGTDAITFTARSDSVPEVLRTYHSLTACADEVGMSRVYGGIHFPFDNEAGKAAGRQVAAHVLANYLLAEGTLPLLRIDIVTPDQVVMRVHGRVGVPLELEASPDFNAWLPVATGLGIPGGMQMIDTRPLSTSQFYRVRER